MEEPPKEVEPTKELEKEETDEPGPTDKDGDKGDVPDKTSDDQTADNQTEDSQTVHNQAVDDQTKDNQVVDSSESEKDKSGTDMKILYKVSSTLVDRYQLISTSKSTLVRCVCMYLHLIYQVYTGCVLLGVHQVCATRCTPGVCY